MKNNSRFWLLRLALATTLWLALPVHAVTPLWNGAGSATNNYFSNTNNWVPGNAPSGNSINGLPVNFGPLAAGATNTANCDATGNSGIWTFNSGTPPMVITLNSTNQLGAPTGPDVFVNNSTNLQTIIGAFRLFDIGGTTTTRRFNAVAGPLVIAPGTLTLRGDSSPTVWAIELGGSATGSILNCGFANSGGLGGKTINLLQTSTGTWEIVSPLPNLTTNASSVTVAAGTLTLDAANSYTGPTIVSNGATLNTVTVSSGGGAYAVSNTATLGVTLANAGSSLTNASLTFGTANSDATTLKLDLANFGNPSDAIITVTGALTVNGTCTLNLANGVLFPGQVPLIQYGSQTRIAGFALGTLPGGVTASLSNNLANSSLDLIVTANVGANNVVYWNGDVSALWDIKTTANWKVPILTGLTYANTNQVIFDDSAAGNVAVALNSAVQPMSVTFSNSTKNYSVSGTGSMGGYTWLNKLGSGVLTLSNANSYSGPTTVNGGALVLKNLGAVAGSSLNIANGAVVQPNLAGTYSNVTTTINGSSTANGSFGGSLDFHVGSTETWPGQINLNDPSATIGCFGGTCNVTLTGQLTGSGGLTIRPEGGSASSHTATFTISNPSNNYAGSTKMQVGAAELKATLKAGVNNALPVTTTLNLDRAANSGVVYFDLAGYSQTVSALTADFSSNAVINSSGTTGTLVVSNIAANTFSGNLGAAGAANFSFVKTGGGKLTIGGPNNYTGTTTITAGILAVPGLVTATSGFILNSNATLQVAVGGLSSATNIWVNGNVTLAGQLDLIDAGIVSNTPYPVIYYSGTLNTNGLTAAPPKLWAFTIDTSVPHLVRLIPTQSFPLVEFTNSSFAVGTLTTNLGGILRDTPAGPIWYEVRDQTNKLWDFGAAPAVSPWNITVRNLRTGTNSVTIFAQSSAGQIFSNRVQLTLNLGAYPSVRPRPIPSEIWWGGISDNTQMTNYSQWPFVQKYQDGYFLHNAYWNRSDTVGLQQSLATNLAAFNTKYWAEVPGICLNPSPTWYQAQTNRMGLLVNGFASAGIILSEFTHDYHMDDMQTVCQVNPTWSTNDDIAWWTGDLSIASTNYPYSSGIWRDVFNGYYQLFPHIKVGHSSQPEWWAWGGYPAGVNNRLAFTITNSSGQNINFSLNASNIFASFMNMTVTIGHPYFSMQSDTPWDYFSGYENNPKGNPTSAATMRQMIRAYEQQFRSRDDRHTLICNVSDAGTNSQGVPYGGSWATANAYYESSSLSSMYLHQQESGRANRYLFESWYWGVPSLVVPETQSGSYTHLALSAIKYLKGIADTNGNLEPLNLTALATNGTLVQLQLQNNGDVQCLPALAGQPGTVPGVTTRYFTTNGLELTATAITAEGFCLTNMLPPGGLTNLFAVTLASNLTAPTNDNAMLEAFWNPQDPLGIVRDRALFTEPLNPLGFWQDADIGSAGVTGGSALSGTTFTLLGSGADIGGTTDAFHFVYQTNNGDGVFTVRVSSQLAADPSAKAGVMIRENTTAGARNVFLGFTPGGGVSFQNRPTPGGSSLGAAAGGFAAPYWVQLVRSGTMFTASYSSDGVNWTTLGSSNVTGFASTALWGLAVTAHNNTLASAATFDSVSIAGNPLWNGAGSVTNNNFSNPNNWAANHVPSGNSINNAPIGFGPLASGATNTANCDATGNSQTWTFNAGTVPMLVTLNGQQLGAATGLDVFVNNSTNLQTINGTLSLFDIGGDTTSRRFNAAAGPLAIATSQVNIRGDSAPAVWAIELGGADNGILSTTFSNVNDSGTVNYLKTGGGTWEVVSVLPDLTTNASSLTINSGTLTLDAANTYTGPTTIANGAMLNVTTLASGAGTYSVSNTATLGVTLASAGSSLTNASLTLGVATTDATTLNLNLGNFGNPANAMINVTGALTVNGTCTLNLTNGAMFPGQFPLIKFGSQSGIGGLVLGTLPVGVIASLTNNTANNSLDLVVTGYNNLIYWNGNLNALWDLNTTANWKLSPQTGLKYANTNRVIFDDSATGNYAVTLNSVVQPITVTFSNSASSYSLSGTGSIGGYAWLNKLGGGVLILSNANSFSGPTMVNGGALALKHLGAVAGSALNVANGAVVQPNLAGTYSNVTTTLNGSSRTNGSFGGSLDFHVAGTETWPGSINLNATNATIGCFGSTCNVTLSGQLTGSGSLTLRPEGGSTSSHTAIFTLSNPGNNYAGSSTMQVGTAELNATLKAGVDNALPVTTTLNLNRVGSSGTVYFDLAGYNQTVAGLTANFGSNAVINSTGTGTLTISNTANTVFNGAIGASGRAGINLIKQGDASLTLNGTNLYTGSTAIGSGILALNGLITATSGLLMSSNATLQLGLGASGGPTNIVVNGDVTLAGQISVSDFGIVSNTPYPVIYYTGNLTNNGITVAPSSPWLFTVDTSAPHIVSLVVTSRSNGIFSNGVQANAAPVLNPITDRTLIAGQTLTLTNTATDLDSPSQTLTFSLLVGPTGMTMNSTNGILTWRPTMAQAPSTNSVAVQVSDNGTPPLSAMQNFQVTVTAPAVPTFVASGLTGGGFSMLVNGSAGPDYYFQSATNLTTPILWLPLQTNFSATPPFLFTDPTATNFTHKFYRVLLGP